MMDSTSEMCLSNRLFDGRHMLAAKIMRDSLRHLEVSPPCSRLQQRRTDRRYERIFEFFSVYGMQRKWCGLPKQRQSSSHSTEILKLTISLQKELYRRSTQNSADEELSDEEAAQQEVKAVCTQVMTSSCCDSTQQEILDKPLLSGATGKKETPSIFVECVDESPVEPADEMLSSLKRSIDKYLLEQYQIECQDSIPVVDGGDYPKIVRSSTMPKENTSNGFSSPSSFSIRKTWKASDASESFRCQIRSDSHQAEKAWWSKTIKRSKSLSVK